LSKSHSECALASGGVLPPQLICCTPILVSTWHFTAQFFSSLAPLSVTTLMDLPSGEMTQPASARGAWREARHGKQNREAEFSHHENTLEAEDAAAGGRFQTILGSSRSPRPASRMLRRGAFAMRAKQSTVN
jgi:hypothetical protein